jgi:phosphinothricin acetyltransferase
MAAAIRIAKPEDAYQVLAIYAPFCSQTPVSFEVEPPRLEEMRRRIADTLARYPWLVCEDAGEIIGYVYASRHRERAAYQWSVDVTVYVHNGHRRQGIGRALYTSLFHVLKLQGFCNAHAGITLPNPASVALHESLGFQPVGVYRGVGYKCGAWHDVGWWQLALRPREEQPAPPTDFPIVQETAALSAALAAALRRHS